uniref:Protein groES n=2 Tax=Ostreococcus mediterraneus TaxID=1486918 RepID=A0A7S1EP43_9CHLO
MTFFDAHRAHFMSATRRLIKPLLDRVLVEKITPPTKSLGGVLLPESMTAGKLNEGMVVACGPGRRTMTGELVPLDVKDGDTVVLPEFGGTAINVGDKEMFVYREEELIGVVPK